MDPNLTKNQHYLSQAEQRLNAIDPALPTQIFSFDVLDRDAEPPSLSAPQKRSIRRSLAWEDLFSFDIVDPQRRSNFEELFGRYEQDIRSDTEALLKKLHANDSDLKKEVVDIFAAKFLNACRNPFSALKVLNTFGAVETLPLSDPSLSALYEKVLAGSKPHESAVCAEFGFTPEFYRRWLRMLFRMFARDGATALEPFTSAIKGLLASYSGQLIVSDYEPWDDRHVCLVSDRGCNIWETDGSLFFECNLTARACAVFVFNDLTKHIPAWAPPAFVAAAKATMNAHVSVTYRPNNLQMLAMYNRRTVSQCFRRVYAAQPSPLFLAPEAKAGC